MFCRWKRRDLSVQANKNKEVLDGNLVVNQNWLEFYMKRGIVFSL